jgi:hypothetical protein
VIFLPKGLKSAKFLAKILFDEIFFLSTSIFLISCQDKKIFKKINLCRYFLRPGRILALKKKFVSIWRFEMVGWGPLGSL